MVSASPGRAGRPPHAARHVSPRAARQPADDALRRDRCPCFSWRHCNRHDRPA